MRMKTSATYWGWEIEITTEQQADGSWRGTAQVRRAGGAAPSAERSQKNAASATSLETPSSITEAEARSAAEAQARGWVDRARVGIGKA
jgi:hypothetical protein